MSASVQLKTSFETHKTLEELYTGGIVKLLSDDLYCTCGDAVNVVNIKTGQKSFQYKDDGDEISCFTASPDGTMLITASKNLLLHQFDLTTKQLKRRWKATHKTPILCMEFDATSTLLATGSSDTTIKIYDTSKQYLTHNFKGTEDAVSLVCYHPDAEKLVLFSSSVNGKIRMWCLKTSKCLSIFEGHFSQVTGIEFSKDQDTMISSGRDKVLIIWDLKHRNQIKTIPVFEHIESITSIQHEVKGNIVECIIGAGQTGCLRIWSLADGRCVYVDKNYETLKKSETKELDNNLIFSLINNEVDEEIIAITYDHNIIYYSTQDMNTKKQLIGYLDEIVDLKYFGEHEESIAIASNSEHLKIVDNETSDANILYGHTGIVLSLDVSFDGKYIASSSKDNTIRVWCLNEDTKKFNCVAIGKGHTHWVGCVAWPRLSTDFIISGSQDCTIKLWTLPTLIVKSETIELPVKWTEKAHEKDINAVAVSPNDKLVVSASQDKTAKIWKRKSGRLLGTLRGHKRGIWCVAFSPVDQCIATGSADSSIKIWALSDYTCVKTFEGHTNSVLRVLFIQRGTQIISSSSEGLIKLWNVRNDECVATLEAHDDKVWALAVKKSEDYFVSGGGDSTIKYWKDVTEQLLAEKTEQEHEKIEQEQNLQNLLKNKNYVKAIGLAIVLDKPYKVLNVVKTMLLEDDGREELNNIINNLNTDQLESLLNFICSWNTNAKHSFASQTVLSIILKSKSPEELLELSNIKHVVESLLPYTERHYNRVNQLVQQSMFVNYTWESMKLSST